MKKFALCTLLAIGTLCTAHAQDKTFSFGLRAGLNINRLFYSGPSEAATRDAIESRPNFHIGAIFDCKVTRNFYIQPGVYFTTRGARLEETGSEQGYKYSLTEKINMNYLQIPIQLSYRIPVAKILKIDLNAGPYVAYGVGGRVKDEVTVSSGGARESASESYDVFGKSDEETTRGGFKRFDAGLRFGAGIYIRKFTVGVAYDLGLANLADTKDEYGWASGTKYRNGSFQVSVGYNF